MNYTVLLYPSISNNAAELSDLVDFLDHKVAPVTDIAQRSDTWLKQEHLESVEILYKWILFKLGTIL